MACNNLSSLMSLQRELLRKHLDEHQYLRHIEDKTTAISSFIAEFGWIVREMFCTSVCDKRGECEIAKKLRERGDLLCDRVKQAEALK